MRDSIVFFVNGQRHEVRGDDVLLTLAEWLRGRQSLVGTKVVCNEGDCGACSVLVGRVNAEGNALQYSAIDSCIAFPFQLDKTHVVTVEGLKSRGDLLSPVQQAMVNCHGSQCGFCTPGFVTTMHGMFEEHELQAGRESPNSQSCSSLCDEKLRYGLSGNLCRCTGYLQIIDAGKSIDPSQVEPLNERYPPEEMLVEFAALEKEMVCVDLGDRSIVVPQNIDQVVATLDGSSEATLVAGATDYGVLHNHGRTKSADIISLSSVSEFDRIEIADGVMKIGGGATWSNIERFVREHVPQYHEILTRFGSPQIRNAGTLAGNLAGGSPIGDSIPFHLVMDAELELTGPSGVRTVKLADFYTGYRQNVMANDELITLVSTPLPKADERLSLHKISKRRDMDISTETLGVWLKLEKDSIIDARVAIGGVGPTVMRIDDAEAILIGKTLSKDVLREAGQLVREHISPWSDVRGSDEYRLMLAENLLVKSYADLALVDGQLGS